MIFLELFGLISCIPKKKNKTLFLFLNYDIIIWKYIGWIGEVLKRNQIQMLNRWVDKWGHCYQFNPHMDQLVSHREELCSKATDCTINPSQPSPNCVSLITRGPGMSVNSSEQTHHHLCEQSHSLISYILHQIDGKEYYSKMEKLKASLFPHFLNPVILLWKVKNYNSIASIFVGNLDEETGNSIIDKKYNWQATNRLWIHFGWCLRNPEIGPIR